MQFQRQNNTYIIRLEKGEELISCLGNFCQDQEIEGGTLIAIGATSHAKLGYLPAGSTQYQDKTFEGAFEVASLSGNISEDKIHLHAVISNADFQTFGGHVFELIASPTLEITLHKFEKLTRKMDQKTGLTLLNLPNEL